MTITVHDFTRPPPLASHLRAVLAQWFGRSNALLTELLAGLSVPVELRFEDSSTVFPAESLSVWSDKALAFHVRLPGQDIPSLIALPNPFVQDLVSRILGDVPDQQPDERDLTPVELAVAEIVVETIVKSLKETWQGDSTIELSVGEVEPNLRRTKLFRPTESLVVCRSIVRTSLGDAQWCWFLTNEFLTRLLGLPTRSQRPADGQTGRRHLERLIRGMQTEIEVRLGGVQLTGPQLARLRVGDVVVLDQRVSEPLRATVRGEPKYLGWAGRVGNRQGFEIESEVHHGQYTDDISDVA